MDIEVSKKLYEAAIGHLAVKYIETLHPDEIMPLAGQQALDLLSEIKDILNDDTLDDPTCFHRVDALVQAFCARGILIYRHDW